MTELRGTMIDLGDLEGYLTRPADGAEVRGGLVLIHEIWGLADHIKDVADRFAAEGYVVIAPDILSHIGLDPDTGAEIRRMMFEASDQERSREQPALRDKMAASHSPEYAAWAVPALRRTVDRLAEEAGVGDRIAVAGFCFGGSYSFELAAADPRIRAAAPFYGSPSDGTDYDGFGCPILAFYGGRDERLMGGLDDVTEKMAAHGVAFEPVVYPDAQHAFFNDTNAQTYDADAAADAWQRVLAFLSRTLA